MKRVSEAERGAALIVVLAMLFLLSGLATLGLSRLRAATDQVVDAQARSEAGLAVESGVRAAQAMAIRKKAAAQQNFQALGQPVHFDEAGASVRLSFSDGGVCFNLNSLGRRPGSDRADASPEEFARLLQAAGAAPEAARQVATATAARLTMVGMLWADPSEWTAVPGVSAAMWQQASPHLCTLPTREASAFSLNALQPGNEPVLVAMGMGMADARSAIQMRPPEGWSNAQEFWASAGGDSAPASTAAAASGRSSRWLLVEVTALTANGTSARVILLDTVRSPARIAQSVWLPPPPRDRVIALMQEESV